VRYRYFICDVFTDTRFGGNQLAVLPEATGLSDRQMQQIAREFNFPESTFVFPAEAGHTRKVRIFTPATEMPFAGHPNVGTAFVLATAGELGPIEESIAITFEEKAGLVPITIQKQDGRIRCELKAPQRLSLGKVVPAEMFAQAVSLDPGDIVTRTHPPQVASVGLPFVIAEIKDREALKRARAHAPGLEAIQALGITPDVHLYIHSGDEFDIRARMFAPFDGVPEDPATGSANCALAELLTTHKSEPDGSFQWRIAQGVEMGRPSNLAARTEKRNGEVVGTWIGGACVLVSEGWIEAD
jgi:trans-2,3-dihydro-3-hydroxyanthranilate isomerase